MGIPSYFSYVLKNHKRIIKRLHRVKLNTLLIDANSFIYDVVYELNIQKNCNYQIIYENVYKKIKELVKKLNVNSVFVAFDGTVPLAKMKQQKQRRYKSWITKNILNKNTWNTNNITPGTTFMIELDQYIKPLCEKDGYLYSGSNEPGEGEQKLFQYLRNNPSTNTVIYGLDADLIMLSLLHLKNYPKLFLYRETKHFAYLSGINEENDYLFNIYEMGCEISNKLYENKMQIEKAVNNYCLLCFLCGNDFLPHFPSINIRNNGIQYLLDILIEINEDIVIGTQIQWPTIHKLFCILASKEK